MSVRAALAAVSLFLGATGQAHAAGLLKRNHPLVEKGMDAYRAGRYQEALDAFDAAKRELPSSSAQVEFDRGAALFKLGRHAEAAQALERAAEEGPPEVRQRAHYNLGNVHAAQGNRPEAIAAYRKALLMNPKDADARHNLELLLRDVPPPRSSPDAGPPPDGGDGGQSDAGRDGGRPDSGQDGGQDGGRPDGGPDGGPGDAGPGRPDGGRADGGPDQRGPPDAPRPDGGQRPPDGGMDEEGQPTPSPEQTADAGVGLPPDEAREEAERLLDSVERSEKSLQLWKFQQKKPRKQNEKDW